jgi:hypothetical protein
MILKTIFRCNACENTSEQKNPSTIPIGWIAFAGEIRGTEQFVKQTPPEYAEVRGDYCSMKCMVTELESDLAKHTPNWNYMRLQFTRARE